MVNAHRRFRVQVNGEDVDLTVGPGYVQFGDEQFPCSLHELSDGWYHLILDGSSHSIFLPDGAGSDGQIDAAINGKPARVLVKSERDLLLERFGLAGEDDAGDKAVRAPMPGLVLETFVQQGQAVHKGEGLLVLEAMKMENEIRAPSDGTVKLVHVVPGEAVTKNDLLVELE